MKTNELDEGDNYYLLYIDRLDLLTFFEKNPFEVFQLNQFPLFVIKLQNVMSINYTIPEKFCGKSY